MKTLFIAAALALTGIASAHAATAVEAAQAAGAATPSTADGTGVVKAIDAKAGSITLQHSPIAAINWPAMTMPFKIDPSLLNGVKVGQKVNFTVKPDDTEILAIKPAS